MPDVAIRTRAWANMVRRSSCTMSRREAMASVERRRKMALASGASLGNLVEMASAKLNKVELPWDVRTRRSR